MVRLFSRYLLDALMYGEKPASHMTVLQSRAVEGYVEETTASRGCQQYGRAVGEKSGSYVGRGLSGQSQRSPGRMRKTMAGIQRSELVSKDAVNQPGGLRAQR